MKTLNPVEDLITKTAKLYFELCHLAENRYQMGPHSGAKRTILLYLNLKGPSVADELWEQFPDPTLRDHGPKLIMEMAQACWITTEHQRGRVLLMLTEHGRAKVEEIIKQEALLAAELPSELNLAELRRTIKTIEAFRETIAEAHHESAPIIAEEAS